MIRLDKAYLEPIDIFEKIGERKSELPDECLGFICELIRKYSPRKIVEIGVSAGGTTCVIMNCLQKLGLDSEVYSVDLSETYHYDRSKQCGYQIKQAENFLSNYKKHKLILGKTIAEVIEDISDGKEIDMLILDTIHYLPGELLDFLVCLPFLSSNAVVVLDDLIFAHTGENTKAVATQVLFDVIVADKIYPMQQNYPKMGAFRLNVDTRKYKDDYFSALILPWNYSMPEQQLDVYSTIIEKHYDEHACSLFSEAIRINGNTIEKVQNVKLEIKKLLAYFDQNDEIYIYGAGARGSALGNFLADREKQIKGFIISNDRVVEDDTLSFPVYHLQDIYEKNKKKLIMIAAADLEIDDVLSKTEFSYIRLPNYIFPFIKQYSTILL